ncbi:heavy metal sensor histidine kinase [Paucibacter sp. XJ19-41]|uniref:heavy metal sensor histidine kinase n=1 Tax=Paucibacter sp. XJ19-41 TaxID=2927824 RepID=UPI002348F9A9|nr:heavy metal sensor histidine kinase [Paucibacter sp. XJ19-41]MDC6166900.1 heavy metal sensor histidine kinase [Paucibacter sp. XJ19-41]
MSRLPLSWRLGLLFAALVALSCGSLGVYLYQSFAQQLERRDDLQLLGQLRHLRQLLAHTAAPRLLLDQPQYLRDTMSADSNVYVLVHDEAGRLLLDVHPGHEPLPTPDPVPLGRAAGLGDIRYWTTVAGVPAAAVGALSPLGSGRNVRITVARICNERTELLADYRRRIWFSVLFFAVAGGALALGLMWQGLAPLRRLAREAGRITAQRLSTRLSERAAPAEMRGLIAAFNAMLLRLEQGFAQVNQFAADLAHELRTPVGNLLGQSQVMLARPRSAEDYQALLGSNIEELERLNRMIDSMLFLARAEHSAMALQRQALDPAAELARQADYFQDLAEERGLRLLTSVVGSEPLQADTMLLRRALANLLANAVQHAKPGSQVRLSARRRPGAWELSVDNSGEPLPAELLERLFERFYRADPARADSARSSGLGLAIVRSIMTLHGGSATVVQPAAGDISFRLCFPDAAPRAASPAAPAAGARS